MSTYTYNQLEKSGRLGNQLWQIAWQIGSADKNNGSVSIKPDWEYRKFFSVPDEFFWPPVGKVINGDLFYQELHHWDTIPDLIHEYYQPSQLSVDYLQEAYPEWMLDPNVNKTSVHVRAGDYLNHPQIFPVPTDKYYQTAAESIEVDTKFLVFSDNIDYAKTKLHYLPGEVIFVNGVSRPVEVKHRKGEPQDQWDMFLMMNCQQHIIGNSTFSWWGAFLANSNRVHYPSVWWGPKINAKDSRGIDIRKSWVDGIPTEWRKVEC